jgi:hypothetical protein
MAIFDHFCLVHFTEEKRYVSQYFRAKVAASISMYLVASVYLNPRIDYLVSTLVQFMTLAKFITLLACLGRLRGRLRSPDKPHFLHVQPHHSSVFFIYYNKLDPCKPALVVQGYDVQFTFEIRNISLTSH